MRTPCGCWSRSRRCGSSPETDCHPSDACRATFVVGHAPRFSVQVAVPLLVEEGWADRRAVKALSVLRPVRGGCDTGRVLLAHSSRTGPLWVWPADGDLGDGRDYWQMFARAVTACGLGVPVTTDDPVLVWADRIRDEVLATWGKPMPWRAEADVAQVAIPDAYLTVTPGVGSVAVADLYALAPLIADGGVSLPENAAVGLQRWGRDRFAMCTVRDMVGWIMASAQADDGQVANPLARVERAGLWAARWAGEGSGPGGWWYLLAGFTIDEALAAAVDGSVDPGVVRTMVALRGVLAPAGTWG